MKNYCPKCESVQKLCNICIKTLKNYCFHCDTPLTEPPAAKPVEASDVERIAQKWWYKFSRVKVSADEAIRGAITEAIAAKDAEIAALKSRPLPVAVIDQITRQAEEIAALKAERDDWRKCADELATNLVRLNNASLLELSARLNEADEEEINITFIRAAKARSDADNVVQSFNKTKERYGSR